MGSYLVIIAVLIIFFCFRRRRRTAVVAWQILNQRKQNKENVVMKELAKQFIGEECIIYTITSNEGSIQGIIKEIDDGGMVIERNSGEREIVNLDFVTRIRERKTERKRTLCWTKSMYRIFIVEDDEIIAGTVKSYLEKWNYTVLCVENSNNVLYFYSANHAPYTYIDVIFWRLLCSFIGIVISVITRKSRKIHPALWISGIISCMLGFIVCMF